MFCFTCCRLYKWQLLVTKSKLLLVLLNSYVHARHQMLNWYNVSNLFMQLLRFGKNLKVLLPMQLMKFLILKSQHQIEFLQEIWQILFEFLLMKKLLIKKYICFGTRECALPDPYLERLHQVLYNHYGCGNPNASKTTSMFGNFLSNIIPSTFTSVTTAPTLTAGNQTSTNQASPSSSTTTATNIDVSANTPPTESGDQSQSTLSTFMNTWKKMVSSSAPSSSS